MICQETPGRCSRRRLLVGAVAGAAGALLAGCADAPIGPTAAPPATPTVAPAAATTGTTGIAPSPPPSLATATPLPPRTPTAAAPTPTELTTWVDPRGLIQLRYPRAWLASVVAPGPTSQRPHNVLRLATDSSGVTPVLWLDLYDPQRGTLDEAVQRVRDSWVGKPYRLSDEAIEDLTVGGEAARVFTFMYTPTFNPTIHSRGKDFVCNHGGREFFIETITDYENGLVVAAREIDEIVASIHFLT